jgi:aryl-alcohol dehydrogenase-like predicted oxidoreductase
MVGLANVTTPPHGERVVPIPGTRKVHRLEENIGSADVELTVDELGEIEDAASKIEVQGGRYDDEGERRTNL